MRHRRKGRVLGRSPSHQLALRRSLATALFLTEVTWEDDAVGKPKVSGRIITTLPKAKEVRPLVEKCITLALRSQSSVDKARSFGPPTGSDGKIDRTSTAYKNWRKSADWRKWAQAISPHVTARRRVATMLGDKTPMKMCFDVVAPRFEGRNGGYTRIMKLAKPRLGDAGQRAIIEFVGVRDRNASAAPAPSVEA
jgi:large subunit ribosomal protein L17